MKPPKLKEFAVLYWFAQHNQKKKCGLVPLDTKPWNITPEATLYDEMREQHKEFKKDFDRINQLFHLVIKEHKRQQMLKDKE